MKIQSTQNRIPTPQVATTKAEVADDASEDPKDEVTLLERTMGAAYFGTIGSIASVGVAMAVTMAHGAISIYTRDVTPSVNVALTMAAGGALGAAFGATKGSHMFQ